MSLISEESIAKREKDRLARKAQIALTQTQQFEDELSTHELNQLRLDALPIEKHDEKWTLARDVAVSSIDTLNHAIEITLIEIDTIETELKADS